MDIILMLMLTALGGCHRDWRRSICRCIPSFFDLFCMLSPISLRDWKRFLIYATKWRNSLQKTLNPVEEQIKQLLPKHRTLSTLSPVLSYFSFIITRKELGVFFFFATLPTFALKIFPSYNANSKTSGFTTLPVNILLKTQEIKNWVWLPLCSETGLQSEIFWGFFPLKLFSDTLELKFSLVSWLLLNNVKSESINRSLNTLVAVNILKFICR